MAAETRRYVLVTPVKNEEVTLPATIASVVNQSFLPSEWVIVSDGSTDQTNAIIREAARSHPWIHLVDLPSRPVRSFSAVVHAIETGVSSLNFCEYEFFGLLDADVRFAPSYFESLITRFERNPRLGLIGGMVVDIDKPASGIPRNLQDVPGAVQFFRRSCFESLGGLLAIPEGGWDALTCAKARMNGFETRLYPELPVDHLKPRNISQGGVIRRNCQLGVRDYALGYHPLFETFKCIGRVTDSPLLIAAAARWLGFCVSWSRRRPRLLPRELIDFIRREQMNRLAKLFHLRPPRR